MSEHRVTVSWMRGDSEFAYETYSRNHEWRFDNEVIVEASAAAAFLGDPQCVDPEEAFVASLSSCHMLTFLAIAAKKRFTVERYTDDAVGVLEKNAHGKLSVTRVSLQPRITFGGARQPTDDQIAKLHEQAHGHCFIANSVRTRVEVIGSQSSASES